MFEPSISWLQAGYKLAGRWRLSALPSWYPLFLSLPLIYTILTRELSQYSYPYLICSLFWLGPEKKVVMYAVYLFVRGVRVASMACRQRRER